MNAVVKMNKSQTMSSREIADLTGKDHKHVLADIRNMLDILKIGSAEFSAQYKDSTGRSLPCFNLPKRETLILVSGYNIELRAKIIDRWQELESNVRLPQTFAEALQLAADQAKQLELAAPKVAYFDTVVERENLLAATQVSQKFKWSAVKLNKYLDHFDVYSQALKRGRAFKQWFIDAGYGVMRQTEMGFAQPMFTLKGEAWIVEKLTTEGVFQ